MPKNWNYSQEDLQEALAGLNVKHIIFFFNFVFICQS